MKWRNYVNNKFFDDNQETKVFCKNSKKHSNTARKGKNSMSEKFGNELECSNALSMLSKAAETVKVGDEEGFKSGEGTLDRDAHMIDNDMHIRRFSGILGEESK